MRNALVRKLVIILCLFGSTEVFGQSSGQYLDIPPLGQRNAQWCWAASMEMIVKFHEPNRTVSQCMFAERYQWFQNTSSSVVNTSITGCCDDLCSSISGVIRSPSLKNTCDQTIQFSQRKGSMALHYMDLIFSSIEDATYKAYNSIEDTMAMTWGQVQNEINACRPFIIFISKVVKTNSPISKLYNHAVVAKGYYEFNNTAKYILVDDPKSETPCQGCEFLLPESIFSPNVQELNSSLEVVRSIYPKDSIVCNDCSKIKDIKTNILVSVIESNNAAFFGIEKTKFNPSEYAALFPSGSSQNYFATNITYKILTSTGSMVSKNAIGLVAFNTSSPLAFLLDIVNGEYIIKAVSLASCTSFSFPKIAVSDPNKPTVRDTLSNTHPKNEFSVVEFLNVSQSYYSFNIRGVKYLSPIYDYPDARYKKGFY